ncbi:34359_t:CDS:2 [Gigaspora margarita]|uniref:34359_t:CDS:1 n=1 Tax=Gigaspora margarita TaxID=4874 RepID=A0ABM8W4S4_GIGMA|nr:34359_t:CDS:2 [Gigaspora margarita]
MSDDNIAIENINKSKIDKFVFLEPITPQNYLSSFQAQTSNKSYKQSLFNNSNNNNDSNENLKNSTSVEDNYPYIYVTRIKCQRKTSYVYKVLSLGFYPPVVKKTRRTPINGTIYRIPDNYSVSLIVFKIQANRRIRSLAIDIKNNVQSLFLDHNMASLDLEKVNIRYNNNRIELNFHPSAENFIPNEHLDSIIYACEDLLISRENL